MSDCISPVQLTHSQKRAMLHIKRGKNVFITGGAGTGKSFLIKYIREMLEAEKKNVLVCAPTGMAAFKIGGMTIHSLLGLPATPCFDNGPDGIRIITRTPQALKIADSCIIDEVSVCRVDLFDSLITSIKKAERETGRHKQIILIGDFAQLPPISSPNITELLRQFYGTVPGALYAFQGRCWDTCDFYSIILEETVRQKDPDFIYNLNKLRMGDLSCLPFLNQAAYRTSVNGSISLYAYRNDVEAINHNRLDELDGKENVFKTRVVKEANCTDNQYELIRKMIPNDLVLKDGAQIVFTATDYSNAWAAKSSVISGKERGLTKAPSYVNGMVGKVYMSGGDDCVEVVTAAGKIIEVSPVTIPLFIYTTEEERIVRKKVATYSQLPLELAYALTVHKAQGQTYEKAIVCPKNFASGQLYVAMSRTTTIDGLILTRPITEEDVIVDPLVKAFYDELGEGGMSSKKRGRPIKGDRPRTMMLWIPKPLAEQVRESIESDVPFKLRGLPKYDNERVHMRVPDNLYGSIKQGIELWRREAKG